MAALSASEELIIKTRLTTRTQVANGPAPLTKLTRRYRPKPPDAGDWVDAVWRSLKPQPH
jgi:hypothetical protein